MKKLVILCFDTFGDIALRQSFFKALLDLHYDVTVIVRETYAVLLPFLDARLKIITTPINPYRLSTQDSVTELVAQIIALQPDALVSVPYAYTYLDEWLLRLLPQWPRYGFMNNTLRVSFAQAAPEIYRGLDTAGSLFTHTIKVKESAHEFNKTQALFKVLSGQKLTALPQMLLPTAVLAHAEQILTQLGLVQKNYVAACVAGNTNAPIKVLPIEVSAQVLVYLKKKYNLAVLLLGVEAEAAHMQQIAARCQREGVTVQMWIGSSATFGALLGLINLSRFYYGSDTGSMHFAAALGVPVVVHFGGGGWPRFLPLARRSYIVTQKLACFKCGWNCWSIQAQCINLVAPERLYRAIDWAVNQEAKNHVVDLGRVRSIPWPVLIGSWRAHIKKRLANLLPYMFRRFLKKIFVRLK
jgi:ADP-heptose:LPS heptosyltransferase